jgi:cytidylate kinase
LIVTLDGPAGAGKSSVARALAKRLGFEFLDTGAMYRAVTLVSLRRQVNPRDTQALTELLDGMRLEMPPGQVLLDGEDVTLAIRTPEVTAASAVIADSPVVRTRLVAWQRRIADERNLVTEGRDQGTVVFPQAACKFFLTADPVARARRRQQEMAARGETVELEELLRAIEERDRRDAARDLAPMVPAGDAIVFDTTPFTLEQVVDWLEAEVRRRCGHLLQV